MSLLLYWNIYKRALEVKIAEEKEVQSEEEIELFESEIKKMRERENDPQRIINEKELEAYLVGGWQFVSIPSSKKILIRK